MINTNLINSLKIKLKDKSFRKKRIDLFSSNNVLLSYFRNKKSNSTYSQVIDTYGDYEVLDSKVMSDGDIYIQIDYSYGENRKRIYTSF